MKLYFWKAGSYMRDGVIIARDIRSAKKIAIDRMIKVSLADVHNEPMTREEAREEFNCTHKIEELDKVHHNLYHCEV